MVSYSFVFCTFLFFVFHVNLTYLLIYYVVSMHSLIVKFEELGTRELAQIR